MPDPMDSSLESRLARLTPEQRRAVGNFIDFLLRQAVASPEASLPSQQSLPPLVGVAPPPLNPDDSSSAALQNKEISFHDLVRAAGSPSPAGEDVSPVATEIDPHDDLLTHDYMDYGQFDQSPREISPAEKAVRNVKVKMGQKEADDRSRQLLDWID